jgi:hypothetical protein
MKSKIKIIKPTFEHYINEVYPHQELGENQRIQLEQAYYGGFITCFGLLTNVADSVGEATAMRVINQLSLEMEEYSEVIKQRAENS